jgi:hypothetical protein
MFSVNRLPPSLGYLLIAPFEVLFIMVVPILTSGGRYLVPSDIWWGGSCIVGGTTSFLMAILSDQKSAVITDTFALSLGPIGLPNIEVFCLDDSIQLWVMLCPAVAWLVEVLLALVGWPRTRKVVVILFSIEVCSAVRVPAE